MRIHAAGYTLIELLVVISVIAILVVVGVINFKSFSSGQITAKALGEIQTILRLAQTNATSSAACDTQAGVSWKIIFRTEKNKIDLVCGSTNSLQRTYTLDKAEISQIKGSECGSSTTLPVNITYSTGLGTLSFSTDPLNPNATCTANSSFLTFTITNTADLTSPAKTFTISKGGAIDVQ